MKQLQSALNWFEIPVLNFERAQKFYSEIFNYKMAESRVNGTRLGRLPCDKEPGAIGGGIIIAVENEPSTTGVTVYLNGGNDLGEILNRVVEAGGEIILEKTFGGEEIGYFAIFLDSEGNRLGLHSLN